MGLLSDESFVEVKVKYVKQVKKIDETEEVIAELDNSESAASFKLEPFLKETRFSST